MPTRLRYFVALLTLCSPSFVSAQPHDINDRAGIARDRADLLELARVANLPQDAQKRELPHIYRDIWIKRPVSIGAGAVEPAMNLEDRKVTTLSSEAFVKEVEGADGNGLQNTAYRVSRNLLGPHAAELAPIIIESLKSPD